MSLSKSNYYAMLIKTLSKYNLTLNEHKENPYLLFSRDAKFRQWIYSKYPTPGDFTWYNKPLNWLHLIKDFDEDLLYTEEPTQTWHKAFTNYFHSIKTPDTLAVKKQKTEHKSSSEPDSQPSSSKRENEDTLEEPPPKKVDNTEKSTLNESSGAKRKGESDGNPNPAKQDKVTSIATSLKTQTARANTTEGTADKLQTVGNIPGGTSEVQQQQQETQGNDAQLQTNRGNDHNQRGTLQGEAGNIKVQKPLERYGIIKVNMSTFNENSSRNNKIFIFKLETSNDANKLMSLLNETYSSGIIFSTTVEVTASDSKELVKYYLIGWKLSFNLGFTKLYQQLGRNHGRTVVYLRDLGNTSIDDDEAVNTLMSESFKIRYINDTQLFTLAEHVETENKKREQNNNFNISHNSRKRKLPLFD